MAANAINAKSEIADNHENKLPLSWQRITEVVTKYNAQRCLLGNISHIIIRHECSIFLFIPC